MTIGNWIVLVTGLLYFLSLLFIGSRTGWRILLPLVPDSPPDTP